MQLDGFALTRVVDAVSLDANGFLVRKSMTKQLHQGLNILDIEPEDLAFRKARIVIAQIPHVP